ncbi:MAG: HD domain-containing protein [Bacteroidia bacterium]|nr:HD domain-containing protein [Bacteroidia bacterium]
MSDFQNAKSHILTRLENELPEYFTYHNCNHTLCVWQAARLLAVMEGISPEESILLQTAALFHDSGFLLDPDDHEAQSCLIARKTLPKFGYSEAKIDQICDLILATKLGHIPQNHLEMIISDADLFHLGSMNSADHSARLFQEFQARGIISSLDTWLEIEIKFYENHFYHTDSAMRINRIGKREHLNSLYLTQAMQLAAKAA